MAQFHIYLRLIIVSKAVSPLITICLLATITNCQAATISLQTKAEVTVSNSTATLQLTISNQGNEKASDISFTAFLSEQHQERHGLGDILPGRTISTGADFHIPKNARGRIPIYITIFYRHQNGIQKNQTILALAQTDSTAPPPLLSLRTDSRAPDRNSFKISVESPDLKQRLITLTSYGPDEFTISPKKVEITLTNGLSSFEFTVTANKSVSESTSCNLYWIAEYTTEKGFQETIYTTSPFTYTPISNDQRPNLTYYFHLISIILSVLAFALALVKYKHREGRQTTSRTDGRWQSNLIMDVTVIGAVLCALLTVLPLGDMASTTITTGGDTASHYYTLQYLVDTLLPNGQISGWTMGNYAGFPILQFYFPLPFLLMKLLSIFFPLAIAFKLVSMLGIFLLPICIYIMLRDLKIPFPGPVLGSTFSLLFLYHPANSMWGGNILSTLSGEFTYSIGMSLSLILMGSLYRGAANNSRIILNAVLIFLVGFSHGYPLLFVEAVSIFLLFEPKHFGQRFFYLLKTYALGFLFLAFWLVPLLFFGKFTTPYHTIWQINSWQEFVPPIIFPVVVAGGILSMIVLVLGKRLQKGQLGSTMYLWFAIAVAALLYYAGPALGLVDIRFVPFAQLLAVISCASAAGCLSQHFNKKYFNITPLLIILIPLVIFWSSKQQGDIPAWAQWNYSGFEQKSSWSLFKTINNALRGDINDPRVAVENSAKHNSFGSSRAFESLPLFANRSTLEGLYMQASPNAPFIFYIQSLISKESSRPFPQYRYDEMDFARAKPRLTLFNVRDLIIRSEEAKAAISQADGYQLQEIIPPYELWHLKKDTQRYTVPVDIQPIFYSGTDIKDVAFKWFSNDHNLDTSIVFPQAGQKIPEGVTLTKNLQKTLPRQRLNLPPCEVSEVISNQQIDITTNCLDRPLIIKVSYHPNWQVKGADEIYQVTPSFMLIYPKSESITLSYENGRVDYIGAILSGFGILILIINLPIAGIGKFRCKMIDQFGRINNKLHIIQLKRLFSTRAIIVMTVILGTGATAFISLHLGGMLQKNPQRLFEAGIVDKDTGHYDDARKKFKTVIQAQPLSDMARNAMYYIAACYYLQGLDSEATAAFNKIIESDPHSPWRASAYYHLGILALKHNDRSSGRRYLDIVINNFPKSGVADSAREKRRAL